jgi:hypothetical protein
LFRDKKVSGELVGGEREQLAQVNMGNGMWTGVFVGRLSLCVCISVGTDACSNSW